MRVAAFRCPRRRGTAAVEFALLSPMLLGLLLGIWEVGRLVESQEILGNAAREAGRQASTGQRSADQVKQSAKSYVERAGLSSTGIDVQLVNLTNSGRGDPTKAQQLDRFEVKVRLPFANVKWIFLKQFTTVETLSARTEWTSMNNVPVVISKTLPIE